MTICAVLFAAVCMNAQAKAKPEAQPHPEDAGLQSRHCSGSGCVSYLI
jgi:hypothetical protein